ncbi:flagella basal body P-ring formation protein FlgA [Litoreibacter ponti]|uniref:Flagella basal body P-ring formation protein FlgA n=1 Tax=Litoreibacter ponti TaxID=1510457 RepID=A0A2T6BNE6_9RHOB|nr:flagellar basal body P-ring formation chaperone FlgA [Litoreibacter ponti]PTX57572.1 flagella basal body P-ring formation protein FlgA [Litoreibacter ponti]
MRWRALIVALVGVAAFEAPGLADTLVPTRTIRAGDIVYLDDLRIQQTAGGPLAFKPDDIAGLEARRILYAGRPVRRSDFGAPSIVERNQIVTLVYQSATLTIATEGRALGRGGEGDVLRVINLESRSTVTGRVAANGAVWVSQ